MGQAQYQRFGSSYDFTFNALYQTTYVKFIGDVSIQGNYDTKRLIGDADQAAGSKDPAIVLHENGLNSVDIHIESGKDYSAKSYATGARTAKEQAGLNLETRMARYHKQGRLVPTDQLSEAKTVAGQQALRNAKERPDVAAAYSDTEGSDPVVVLPGNNAEVKLLGVKITDGDIHYIRCCARKEGYNGAKWGMSVVKKRASGAVLSGTGANSLVLKSTESSAEGPNSIALGNKVQTKNKGEAAFGNFNASNKYTNEGDEPDTLFSIGNGSEGARRNAFEVKVNGDIYIWLNGSRIKLQNLLSIQQITEGNYGTQVFQPTGEEQDEFVNYDNYEPVGSFGDPDNEYEPVGTFTAEAEGSDGEGTDNEGTDSE